jgi:hypothetical protein
MRRAVLSLVALTAILTMFGCAPAASVPAAPSPAASALPPAAAEAQPAPATAAAAVPTPRLPDQWADLLRQTPVPQATSLPEPLETPLDGTYTSNTAGSAAAQPCQNCEDYINDRGIWRFNLDKGVFRIFHESTGWSSLGSYTVEGERLSLFNDAVCGKVVGRYQWEVANGALKLVALEDTCAEGRRADHLGGAVWAACRPPSHEAAITDHWPKPKGCG